LTVIVVSFFESVFADHSKDHPMAVAYLSSDTLTGIRTPLCWTPLQPSMTAAPMHSHAAVRLALMSIGAGGGAGAPETSVEVVAHKGRVNAVPLSVPNVQVRSGVGRNTLD